ncbi:hypothetical protein ACFQ5M_03110 [Agrilactobacillus yilanensis]|uniref:Uncharacterized protein n=1 Tax=Agrilactobacillus yilanensis TaxID=2485997 RepID=A0ABW4J566_9LACO|nr:hypothetical protein [Agrilactobacillus yilanensis]
MVFKRKNSKKALAESEAVPVTSSPEVMPAQPETSPEPTEQAPAQNTQALDSILENLETATTHDLEPQPEPPKRTEPTHEASLGQLSAQRAETEQQVKGLVQELDREAGILKIRLLAENKALTKVVQSLQANLDKATTQQPAIPAAANPDTELQRRDLQDYQNLLQENQTRLATYFNGQTFIRPLTFLINTSYYILSPDLKLTLSDVDSYALRRLKETFTSNQVLLNIITTNYNANLSQIWQQYQTTGLVAPKAKLLNLYQDLQTSAVQPPVTKVQIPDKATWVHNVNGPLETISDDHGHKIMVIKRRDNKSLWLITYFWEDKPIKRDIFDTYGRLSVTQMIDRTDSQFVTNETFYRDNGSIVLIKDYDHQGRLQIQLLNEANILIDIFATEQDLIAWWLKHKVFQTDSCVVLGLNEPLLAELSALKASHLELWPLITEDDLGSPAFAALFDGQIRVHNVLASSPTVEKAIIQYTNDIRVSTVMPTSKTQQQFKVVLPKLS